MHKKNAAPYVLGLMKPVVGKGLGSFVKEDYKLVYTQPNKEARRIFLSIYVCVKIYYHKTIIVERLDLLPDYLRLLVSSTNVIKRPIMMRIFLSEEINVVFIYYHTSVHEQTQTCEITTSEMDFLRECYIWRLYNGGVEYPLLEISI